MPAKQEEETVIKNIAQRMNAVMQKIDYIQKDKKQEMKYSIVSHDKVTELVRPHMVEQGIVYYPLHGSFQVRQDGNRTELTGAVRFENIDDRDDYIDVASMGYGIDPQDKGPGKAISYMVKYALLKACGLATGDDPDLDQVSTHRSTLDDKASTLERAIANAEGIAGIDELMQDPPTKEILAALQSRNPGEYQRLRGMAVARRNALKRIAADAAKQAGS